MNATPADARVVSSAVMPTEPYFPKTIPIIIVASLAGFVLSSVFILLSELFSGRAIRPLDYDVEDEEQPIEAPVVAAPPAKASQPNSMTADLADNVPPAAIPAVEATIEEIPLDEPDAEHSESLLSLAGDDELREEMEAAAEADVEAPAQDEEFSIGAVAHHLVDNHVSVALAVTLIGDRGSAATVALARQVAAGGTRTILIDMTGSALPTRMMAESRTLPGITNLLTGDVAFAETIHGDTQSDAHILPQGTADARRAMRGADRLGMIIDALANAYDLVLVECGPADVAGVSRLARKGEAEIILSAAGAPMDEIESVANRFIDAGYEDVVLLFGRPDAVPPNSGRKAA